jgi:hypothetical protein
MTRAELREIAIRLILTEVSKGYTIDEAVKRIAGTAGTEGQ